MGEEKTAVEKYAELKLKQDQSKAVFNLLIWGSVIILLLIGFIYSAIESSFITPKVLKNTLSDSFSSVYRPISGMNDHGNGYVMVSVNANNQKEAMNQLREVYGKLSKKIVTKQVDKISIAIYKTKTSEMLLVSDIWIKDLKAVDWMAIDNYSDFAEKSNTTLK